MKKCLKCKSTTTYDVEVCPFCNEPLVVLPDEGESPSVNQDIKNNSANQTYNFTTTRYTPGLSMPIYSKITVESDKINLDIKPRKYNKVSTIFLQDISGINITSKISPCFMIVIISCAVIGVGCLFLLLDLLASILLLGFAALCVWLGRNSKITISLKSGFSVDIYSKNKDDAERFVNEITRRINNFTH